MSNQYVTVLEAAQERVSALFAAVDLAETDPFVGLGDFLTLLAERDEAIDLRRRVRDLYTTRKHRPITGGHRP